MKNNLSLFTLSAIFASVLAGCGGGSETTSAAGTETGRMSNSVTIQSAALTAGQSTSLSARAVALGTPPSSMVWTVSPVTVGQATDPAPVISDPGCANGTFTAPISAATTGQGFCQVILRVPVNAKSGTWRITNTTSATGLGAASHFVDVVLTELPNTGFRVIESSIPVISYATTMLSLSLPFEVKPSVNVTNIKYAWTDAEGNPTRSVIIGANNPIATVFPQDNGIYRFNLAITADVNGVPSTVNGTFSALVYLKPSVNVASAGAPQTALVNEVVKLTGEIFNTDTTATYSLSWRQLDGLLGGPSRVPLSNVNALVSGFVAPETVGTYGFELTVIRKRIDGTQSTTSAQTTVLVQAPPSTTPVATPQ